MATPGAKNMEYFLWGNILPSGNAPYLATRLLLLLLSEKPPTIYSVGSAKPKWKSEFKQPKGSKASWKEKKEKEIRVRMESQKLVQNYLIPMEDVRALMFWKQPEEHLCSIHSLDIYIFLAEMTSRRKGMKELRRKVLTPYTFCSQKPNFPSLPVIPNLPHSP